MKYKLQILKTIKTFKKVPVDNYSRTTHPARRYTFVKWYEPTEGVRVYLNKWFWKTK